MLDLIGVVVGIIGVGLGIWSDWRRRSDREWIHTALANLKPGIQGNNRDEVIKAINNMMEFLKPPPKPSRHQRISTPEQL